MTEREKERAAVVAYMRRVLDNGYPTPARKVDQCEHGRFGWEDCIACYDDELERALCAIERGDHMKGTGDE